MSRKKILLIKSFEDELSKEISLLEKQGYHLLISDYEGTDVAVNDDIDLVIISINFDSSRKSFQQAETYTAKQLPIVFISLTGDQDIMEQAQEMPHYAYVIKEDTGTALLSAVKTTFKLVEADAHKQKATTESEQKYTSLFNSILEGFSLNEIICDEDGKPVDYLFLEMNPAFEKLTGLKRDDVIGKTVLEVLPEIEPVWIEKYGKVALTGETVTFQNYSRALGRYYQATASSHKSKQFAVFFTDITESKETEKELKESQQRTQTLIANSPVIIYSYKIINGKFKFIYVSDTAKDVLGYDPSEMLDAAAVLKEFIHPDDWDILTQNDKQVMGKESGLMPVIEYRCKDKKGNYRWLSDRQRIISNKDGIAEVVGSLSDRSEVKKYEQELKETLDSFNRLAEQSRSFTWTVDETGTYTMIDKIVYKVLGYEPAEIIGKKIWDFHPKEDRKDFAKECLSKIEEAKADTNIENPMVSKNGEIIWVSTTTMPLFDEKNRLIGYQGIDTDITPRKKAEEERRILQLQLVQTQKLEAIGNLAGEIAHDFNNTLAIISGLAEISMMISDEKNPVFKNIEKILAASQRSAKLVHQLLAYARRQPIRPIELNLNREIDNMLDMLKQLLGNNIKIVWKPDYNLNSVKIDQSQVDQIVMSLCVNARDAIAGEGTVTVETQNITSLDQMMVQNGINVNPGEYALIKVSDDGCGMNDNILHRMFEPFFTTKEADQGMGLGLPTVLAHLSGK